MNSSIFICPVCGEELVFDDRTAYCSNGHSYDRAKQGYVNLLMQQTSSGHGDSKDMLRARREFLEAGYYSPLKDKLADIIKELSPKGVILDSGCGEGYYTEAAAEASGKFGQCEVCGIDISRDAVKMAASRKTGAAFAVASVYRLPLKSNSISGILSVFSPFADEEFLRTLKTGGFCIEVIPLEKHLWELKRLIYDMPYENKPSSSDRNGFEKIGFERLNNTFKVDNAAIKALFAMTPYFRKTSKQDAAKLDTVSELEITSSFGIITYIKK